MKRQAFKQLQDWKRAEKRKPLILMGARQVGKTTLLKEFGAKEYEQCAYLNFEENPILQLLFAATLDPGALLTALRIELDMDILPTNTLIIFDEVQECPAALNSLKYFYESASEYHICAAGSLLGVKLTHTKGFPVGKVTFLNLYPLGFFEFLEGIQELKLLSFLQDIPSTTPLLPTVHEKLLYYLKIYLFVGGMPEAVAEYIDTKDLNRTRQIQQDILKAYSLDFAKHAPIETLMKINLIWNSIPNQLSKENKKFIYSVLRTGARAKEYETALQWLLEAGMIYKVCNITTPKLPLDAYANFDFFKIYLVDVGLLGAMSNLSPKTVIHGDELFQEFRGSLVENYVLQELIRGNIRPYYWTSEGNAEVDFIFQHEEYVFPLEIKSGTSNKKKSLRVYAEKYKPKLLIRSSLMNLKKDGDVLNCPLYLIGKLDQLF